MVIKLWYILPYCSPLFDCTLCNCNYDLLSGPPFCPGWAPSICLPCRFEAVSLLREYLWLGAVRHAYRSLAQQANESWMKWILIKSLPNYNFHLELLKTASQVDFFYWTVLGTGGREEKEALLAAAVDCNAIWSRCVSLRVWIEKALYDMRIIRKKDKQKKSCHSCFSSKIACSFLEWPVLSWAKQAGD